MAGGEVGRQRDPHTGDSPLAGVVQQVAQHFFQVRQALQVAGYTRIRDIDYDDGFWEAEATNAASQPVELRIESTTGKVLREKLDD